LSNYKLNREEIIKRYLENLELKLLVASYIRCPQTWRDDNINPNYHRLYYIIDGEGWLKVGNQEFYPQPGELYWLPANITSSYKTISSNTFLKYWCHFTTDINGFDIFHFLEFPFYIKINNRNLKPLFEKLVKTYNSRDFTSPLKCKSILLNIVSNYLYSISTDAIKIRRDQDVNKISMVLNYIENNLSRNISLEELADILHYHPNYFSNFFKSHIGKSPINYLNQLRINKAQQMLISSSFDIKEISDKVGFNSISYFSRYFKKEMGLSPSEYREQS